MKRWDFIKDKKCEKDKGEGANKNYMRKKVNMKEHRSK